MTVAEIRQKFLDFYKARGHRVVPSASLMPENDPTTLFTGSGMQPLVPYFLGQPHPAGRRVADSQKCFRAEDIDEVGDNRHTTFFEMLGNWSFGDYFKQDQLAWLFEFLTDKEKGAGLDPKNLYVTVFAGDAETGIPRDEESVAVWQKLFASKDVPAEYVELGSEQAGSEKGMQGGRIFSYDVKKNWWSRAGMPAQMPAGEPGGPDSEIFYDFGTPHDSKFGAQCHPNCDCGRFLEIGNSVFMEYQKNEDGSFSKLAQRNVDFGGGLERITAAANGDADIFEINIFKKMNETLPGLYQNGTRKRRIILDHLRAAFFLMMDGVEPSNKERGYVLRRLLRRMAFHFLGLFGSKDSEMRVLNILHAIRDVYQDIYPELADPEKARIYLGKIQDRIINEMYRMEYLLNNGKKIFREFSKNGAISAQDAFVLFSTHGFPSEMIFELAEEQGVAIDKADFQVEMKKHQELSRTSSAGTFKGGLADNSEKTTRLHTAHHLLLKALQMVLGPNVKQRGSNITSERLRMDFSYDSKMTDDQKKEVERIVNEKIAEDLPVVHSELAREEAEKLGAEHEFGQKYPDRVSVYSVGPKGATAEDPQFDKAFSLEFCGGPHVARTGEIGKFKIIKEEASSAGIRRIRAAVE
jgi:alanyl-tRNA synthetase